MCTTTAHPGCFFPSHSFIPGLTTAFALLACSSKQKLSFNPDRKQTLCTCTLPFLDSRESVPFLVQGEPGAHSCQKQWEKEAHFEAY